MRNPAGTVASTGNLLTKAGFVAGPADSPHRISEMMKMTPNKFVTRVRNAQLVYRHADPMVCQCVYFGSQQNWDAFRRELEAEQIAKANGMTATESQVDWDFGPLGHTGAVRATLTTPAAAPKPQIRRRSVLSDGVRGRLLG